MNWLTIWILYSSFFAVVFKHVIQNAAGEEYHDHIAQPHEQQEHRCQNSVQVGRVVKEPDKNGIIDHVGVSYNTGNVRVHRIIRHKPLIYASDHFPVFCDVYYR